MEQETDQCLPRAEAGERGKWENFLDLNCGDGDATVYLQKFLQLYT